MRSLNLFFFLMFILRLNLLTGLTIINRFVTAGAVCQNMKCVHSHTNTHTVTLMHAFMHAHAQTATHSGPAEHLKYVRDTSEGF